MSLTYHTFPAPAKLNLMLKVLGRREDGYHILDTVFRFIDFSDQIDIAVREDGQIHLETLIEGVPETQDLSYRAAKLLQEKTGCHLGASIRVQKNIPMGGGLGGGSSDAATVLMALNHLWQLNCSKAQLMEWGLLLGADVPVFIFGENARAGGIGEKLNKINLKEAFYVVLHPPVHVPTGEIFQIFSKNVLTDRTDISIMRILQTTQQVKNENDLQNVVRERYPAVDKAIKLLYDYGPPLMTGSGACVFLECLSSSQANKVFKAVSSEMSGFVAKGLDRHPLADMV